MKETPATILRRNPDYYLKELENNAKRNVAKGYDNDRNSKIAEIRRKRYDKVGYPNRRKWSCDEVEYLEENQGGNYKKILNYEKR